MAPIQTDFRGGGRPALLYVGRKGQLVTLDLFDPRINNYNFVVAAESGGSASAPSAISRRAISGRSAKLLPS